MIGTVSSVQRDFDRRINLWGRLTMGAGILLSIGAPLYMMFSHGLTPGWPIFLTTLGALAIVFGVNWLVEPLTYFPMLGVAGTYQAWLVGNISNKLLPAAITAQASLGVKPGTRKGEIAAISAISGAVIVHVLSLLALVGVGGAFIIMILPERILSAFGFILPAILGAVIMQLCVTVRSVTMAVTAAITAGLVVFVVLPFAPAIASFALLITVIVSATVSVILLREKRLKASVEVTPGSFV